MTTWCRSYTVCAHKQCRNWIWDDKQNPGTRCRKCGTWWQQGKPPTGKGKGQGHGNGSKLYLNAAWPKKNVNEDLMDHPPALNKFKPLKKNKTQQSAAELLATTWEAIPSDIQGKFQALGLGPPQPEEPGLAEVLQTHLNALPQAVQDVVNKLNQPIPDTEEELAQKLKTQVTELKTISMKKAQLQTKRIRTHVAGHARAPSQTQRRAKEAQDFVRAVHASSQQDTYAS